MFGVKERSLRLIKNTDSTIATIPLRGNLAPDTFGPVLIMGRQMITVTVSSQPHRGRLFGSFFNRPLARFLLE
jgi:hypothetical protein